MLLSYAYDLQYVQTCEVNMLAVRLPEHIEKRIAELASRTGRTKTYYVKEAIMGQIDELEDKYLALGRLENPAKRWSLEEMEQGRDMEG